MKRGLQGKDRKNVKRILAAAGFSYAGVCFFPELLPEGIAGFSHSALHLAVFAVFMMVYLKGSSFLISPYSYALGAIYSFCLLAGKAISETGILPLRAWRFLGAWAVFSILAAHGLEWGYRCISDAGPENVKEGSWHLKIKRRWIWAGIFLAWLPVWLALYPGAFAYDAEFAYEQIRTGELTSHHPVLHTLILGNAVRLGGLSGGGYNLGIALYCLFQMAVMSFIFSYVIDFIRKTVRSRRLTLLAFIWYAFFPVISITAGCTTKDVLFTGAALADVLFFYQFIKGEKLCKKDFILWLVINWMVIVLRNTGIYIFLLYSVIFFCSLNRHKRGLFLKNVILTLSLWLLYIGPFYRYMNVEPADKRVMFSIPVQQMARVYNRGGDLLPHEKEILFEILPQQRLEYNYEPRLADPMNGALQMEALSEAPLRYINLWIQIGIRNPGVYISSFLDNTIVYWYPDGLVDGYTRYYKKHRPAEYELYRESSYFAPITEPPGRRESKLPFLESVIMRLMMTNLPQNIPVISMLFSPGMMLWILTASLGYCLRKKKKGESLALLFMLIIVLACFAGPIALIRYCLILFYGFPVVLACFADGNCGQQDERSASCPVPVNMREETDETLD